MVLPSTICKHRAAARASPRSIADAGCDRFAGNTDRNMGIRIMRGKAVRATIDEGFETSSLLQKERVHYLVRAL
jgi:hypothetical protein